MIHKAIKRRTNNEENIYNAFMNVDEHNNTINNEINQYVNMVIPNLQDLDLIEWWSHQKNSFPSL